MKTRKRSGYRKFTTVVNGQVFVVKIHGVTNAVIVRQFRKKKTFQCSLGELIRWSQAYEKGELPI